MQKQADPNNGAVQVPLEEALGQAFQLHQSGDLEQAQLIYRSILNTVPNEINALHFLGIALHQSGDSAGGIELIERSIALAPHPHRYSDFGNVLLQVGRFEEATHALKRSLELDPNNAIAHNNLGVVLKAQKRFDEAESAFKKALAIHSQLGDAHNNLGDLMVMQERHNECIEHYCKALALMPMHIGVKKRLASAYYTLGEIEKAAEIYQQWLAQEPDNPIARHHLAACT
ncbi:MAG TPA: tetratricopeptide repeat protein [Spongiibacteraceae bacterium]|nr:tetratricopeptide repeat protein [Spongiibacteraceae bacterium]